MPNKETSIKNATILATYLVVVWGFYRFLFELPEEVEDMLVKPVLWLLPMCFLLKKERKGLASVGITLKNLFPSVYFALALGMFFVLVGFVVNYIKYSSLNFTDNIGEVSFKTALLLSFATAIVEETVFRGFIFNRVWHALGKEWKANILTSLVWALVHVPVALFRWNLELSGSIGILVLIMIFGIGSSYIFARTKNVMSSVFLHILWSWPIMLFR